MRKNLLVLYLDEAGQFNVEGGDGPVQALGYLAKAITGVINGIEGDPHVVTAAKLSAGALLNIAAALETAAPPPPPQSRIILPPGPLRLQ